MALKKIRAYQFGDHGKPRFQGRCQADRDIVAIDVKPLGRGATMGVDQTSGWRLSAIKKGLGETVLHGAHTVAGRSCAARVASAFNVSSVGTSVSHSINVGLGPAAAMVWA